jgi:EAL and modified HD-GYP domain-containing signal transduction protein
MIALDDFNADDERQPLLKYASLLKIDIRDKERGEIALLIEQTKRYSAKTVAKKVETYEEYNFMRSLDCDYFQGFFFRKPSVVPGKRVNIAQHSAVQLLAIIQKSEIDSDELREVISKDVGLSYKLLRYINSAYFSLPRNVESIQQAILYLGMKQMKLWATVLMLSTFSNKPSELLVISLMRAKTCEKLAQMAGEKDTEQFFLVGLMSTLDVLLDRPMHEVLESLPLSREVRNAILLKTGIEGEALQCVLNYEQWDMAPVRFGSLRPGEIRTAILESLAWANNLAQQVNRIE